MFSGSKAPMSTHGYYVRVLDVCMMLACVCVCMLSGWGPMGNLYSITCYTCMFICCTGLVVRFRAMHVILTGRGPLYSMGMARYASQGGAHYTHRAGPLYV